MEKIAYFEDMNAIANKYWNSRNEFEATKDKIYEDYGYDSDEMKQYYAKAKEIESNNPYTPGEYKALRMYNESINYEYDELMLNYEYDKLILNCSIVGFWDSEIEDFINCLKTAGVKSFVYIDNSTALMDNIHGFSENGFVFDSLYTREEKQFLNHVTTYRGIRFVRK